MPLPRVSNPEVGLAMTDQLTANSSSSSRYFGAGSHGDGTPTRMSREKSGDWSAALAWGLTRARSINSLSGIVVTTAWWS